MAVCMAGMHRSGTSMVARVLNLLGVYLGPEGEQSRAAPDNEAGFWEDPRFVELNDDLLARLGGTWDAPPVRPDWQFGPFEDLLARARDLIAPFRDRTPLRPWGWKDPRNSLVLPFWLSLLPDLLVVVVVRNPFDVSASLRARNGFPVEKGLELWRLYNEAVLASAAPERRLVTRYEAYFMDFDGEARRAAAFLGLEAAPERWRMALESVRGSLRHHRFSDFEVPASEERKIPHLYEHLRVEAEMPVEGEATLHAAGQGTAWATSRTGTGG
jgi:hypothetical protein